MLYEKITTPGGRTTYRPLSARRVEVTPEVANALFLILIGALCADFRATRGQLEIAEKRIAELIEDKRRIEARAKWAEMMLSDWYAQVLTPDVFEQEIRAWLERIGAIEP